MQEQQQQRPHLPFRTQIASRADAQRLINDLDATISALSSLVLYENDLVRNGRLKEAGQLESSKTALANQYIEGMERFKHNRDVIHQACPGECEVLKDRHETLRTHLQDNMTVLATAQSVSESILRGVAEDLAKDAIPKTYTSYGQASAPSRPLSSPLLVSRVS